VDTFVAVLIGVCGAILVAEGGLWKLFRRKTIGICFSENGRDDFAKFFTFPRIRLFAALHTVMLCAVAVLSISFLW